MNRPDKIIIHCSATREGRDYTLADITGWHKARGFRTCGYHYIIHPDGRYERGRQDNEEGAHCIGQNKRSIGICYIGGLDAAGNPKDTRTEAQKRTLISLIRTVRARYGHKLPVYGHRDFANKACPCFDAHAEYKNL